MNRSRSIPCKMIVLNSHKSESQVDTVQPVCRVDYSTEEASVNEGNPNRSTEDLNSIVKAAQYNIRFVQDLYFHQAVMISAVQKNDLC